MFLAKFTDIQGFETCNLYDNYSEYYSDTFSPDCEESEIFEFKLSGKTYQERKAAAHDLAVAFSHLDLSADVGLSWSEVGDIQSYFERIGRRYGLLHEFRENAIC